MLRYVPFCGVKDGLLQCGLTWGEEPSGRVRV
ncbi:unknown [Prevotella sp. CAG:255]|nr:unknown [Prevotella sp. CAG:255]